MFVSSTFHFPSFHCFFRRCCKNKCSNKSNSDDQLDSCRDHCEEEASCSEASSSSDSGGGSCSSKIRDCCDCIEDECSKESGDSADKARALHMFRFIHRNIFSPRMQLGIPIFSDSLSLLSIPSILQNNYSTTRSALRTNARTNTARMLAIASMVIETSGRRSLTGSATSSGKTGCAAFVAYFRNFREKSK